MWLRFVALCFLSPQFLVKNRDAREVFIDAVRRRVVGLVVIDKVHLHVQHGTSFREEICELGDFFWPIFAAPGNIPCPLFLATTATFPAEYTDDLHNLVALPFAPCTILRGDTSSFQQREILFEYSIVNTPDYVKTGLPLAIQRMKASKGSIVIFVNTRTKAMHLTSKLEKKCDECGHAVDILSLNGLLNKHDKFWRIRFFLRPDHIVWGIQFQLPAIY